jgi:PDZ domain-containing secreted protein
VRGLQALGGLVLVAILAGFVVHLPYVVISPGLATPLDGHVVTVEGARTYPHRESVLFLTVLVTQHDPNVWTVVRGWLDPDRDVEHRDDVVGCLSPA